MTRQICCIALCVVLILLGQAGYALAQSHLAERFCKISWRVGPSPPPRTVLPVLTGRRRRSTTPSARGRWPCWIAPRSATRETACSDLS